MTELTEYSGETATMTQNNLYDHNGIRIMKTEDGASRDYYYDSGACAFTMDGDDVSIANILTPQGSVAGSYRDSTYNTYLKNQQGSTTSIVKDDGTLSAAYDYSDFGETTEITESGFDNQICYTGGIYDDETGLYYLNARYYDPELGRFISQDTYRGMPEECDQWHLYAYCANNPINYVDPSGHWNVTLSRSQTQDQYRALFAIKVAYTVYSYATFIKSALKKAIIDRFFMILGNEITSKLDYYLFWNIYDKYLNGFYKGGYGTHSVSKYRIVKRHKRKHKVKYIAYENIKTTKLKGTLIKPKFTYISKNKKTYKN